MKLFVFVLIIFIFGVIGYEIKKKYIEQKNCLIFFKELFEYIHLNISIYKNNVVEIINNYLIMQKNKNAKYINIFPKNNKIIEINQKNLNNIIFDNDLTNIIKTYFDNLGKTNIDGECEKLKAILDVINGYILKTNTDIKSKGDLYFKIILAIGIVIVIILW